MRTSFGAKFVGVSTLFFFTLFWFENAPEMDHNTPHGTIRVTRDIMFHVIDLVWAVHGSNNRSYARVVLQRVIDSNALYESDFSYIQRGHVKTQLVSFKNAIKLVMTLPGKNAKLGRADFAHVLLHFIGGDTRLKAAIDNNAESTDLLNILARQGIRLGIESSDAGPSNAPDH